MEPDTKAELAKHLRAFEKVACEFSSFLQGEIAKNLEEDWWEVCTAVAEGRTPFTEEHMKMAKVCKNMWNLFVDFDCMMHEVSGDNL